MLDIGTVRPGSTIRIPYSTFAGSTGASATQTGFAASDIQIYKDGGTTQRADTTGFTATTDFDSSTGLQLLVIDLSSNAEAGFYAAGSEYLVAVADVTVDSQTVRTWVARFRIGYPGAVLDTTIATLTNQTSFTLTAGPAEDDALNGCVAVIHDVASAVQVGLGYVSDYTGSTKTVTLAAGVTFTAAASDNISFFAPVHVFGFGGTAGTFASGRPEVNASHIAGSAVSTSSAQIGVNVVNVAGSAVSASSGLLNANVTQISGDATAADNAESFFDGTGYAGTGNVIPTVTTVTNQLTAAQVATGVWQDATAGDFTAANSIGKCLYIDNVVPGGTGGHFIAGTNAATTITTALTTTFTGNLTGSVASVSGAVGSVTGNVGGNVTGSVGSVATGGIAAASFAAGAIDAAAIAANAIGASELASDAVAEIADAVWEEAIADHSGTAGSTAEALAAAGSAGDPWVTALPGAYGAGSAGYIVGNNLNATVSSRASQTSVDTIDTIVDSILADTGTDGVVVGSHTTAAKAEIEAEANDALIAQNLDHLVKSAVDTDFATTVHLNSVIGQIADDGTSATFDRATDSLEAIRNRGDSAWITATGFSTLDAAGVRSAVGLASANLDTQLAAIDDYLDTEVAAILAAVDTEVAAILADTNELQTDWANGGRLDLLVDAIKAKTDNLPAAPAATGDIPTVAQVWAQAMTELSAVPGVTGTVLEALTWCFEVARNKITQTSTTQTLFKDDGSTTLGTSTVSDDGTTFTRGEYS